MPRIKTKNVIVDKISLMISSYGKRLTVIVYYKTNKKQTKQTHAGGSVLLVPPEGIGLASRRLPPPRTGHRLAVLLASLRRKTSLRRSIPSRQNQTKQTHAGGSVLLVPPEGIEPPSTVPKTVVLSITPRRLFFIFFLPIVRIHPPYIVETP